MNAIAATDIPIRGSPAGAPVGGGTPAARPAPSEPRPAPAPVLIDAENQPDPEDVKKAADGVNAFLKSSGSHIQFALHAATKRMMVEVIDDTTQEVIRTIPSKELLDLSAKMGEMVGVLLDKKG